MDLGDKAIWQVAAGDTDRSYHDLCLRWDVILFGPGYRGPWPECKPGLTEDRWTTRKIGLIRKFCETISPGDLIVLRLGTAEVYGVGEVVGDYQWYDDLGDVDGWYLQFVRRVRWLWRYNSKNARNAEPKRFPTFSLKFGDTIQPLDSQPVLKWIKKLKTPSAARKRKIVQLPATCVHKEWNTQVQVHEIAEYLFDQGVAAGAIDALIDGMDALRRIASWYDRSGIAPSESETVAYLVVPLLRALGWTPQRMAVEWNHVDLALFSRMPRADDNLAVAVEVKKRNLSCLSAKSQAEGYAEQEGREGCRRLIVTDGIRYGVYLRNEGGEFPDRPAAYLNLNRMIRSYPILECAGAAEALRLIAADWSGDTPSGIAGQSLQDVR